MSRHSCVHAARRSVPLIPLVLVSACAAGATFPPDPEKTHPPTETPPPGTTSAPLTLGAAEPFAVLAGSTVSNVGVTEIDGQIGVSPGDTISGLPGSVPVQAGNVTAYKAQTDLEAAVRALAARTCTTDLTGKKLEGMKLVPGVYCLTGSLELDGALQLDAQADPKALFVFKISGALTLRDDATIKVVNGGSPCQVYWQMGGSVKLGKNAEAVGNLVASADIDLQTGASLAGRALTRFGAVTLDTNYVALCAE